MLDELKKAKNIVIGTKQVVKALKAGLVQKVFVAEDADNFMKEKLLGEITQTGTDYEMVAGMKILGEACKIQVGSATAAILK